MLIWPDVFVNPPATADEYRSDLQGDDLVGVALADQCCGWACTHMEPAPENFGRGMALLASITGSASPDHVSRMADDWLARRKMGEGA